MRINRQKGERLDDKSRCVIHLFDSSEVRERIKAAHERLDLIEAAEKVLRVGEEGNPSPTSPLST